MAPRNLSRSVRFHGTPPAVDLRLPALFFPLRAEPAAADCAADASTLHSLSIEQRAISCVVQYDPHQLNTVPGEPLGRWQPKYDYGCPGISVAGNRT